MAWTAPATWIVLEVPTASKMNTHIRDNLNALSLHAHTGAAGDGALMATQLEFQVFSAR